MHAEAIAFRPAENMQAPLSNQARIYTAFGALCVALNGLSESGNLNGKITDEDYVREMKFLTRLSLDLFPSGHDGWHALHECASAAGLELPDPCVTAVTQ